MLSNISQSKWGAGTSRQVILKNNFVFIAEAVHELANMMRSSNQTKIYPDNENTANQNYLISSWDE